MTTAEFINNLEVPVRGVDVVLDTDTYNEIDDQFALAYLLAAGKKLKLRGICAAPFFNSHSTSPADGMEKSRQEILKLLRLAGREDLNTIVYPGSRDYLPDENTPVMSEAARFMAELVASYNPKNPLYIIAIGAITNVASALLINPKIKENTVIVWLGGHGLHWHHNREFNLMQDVAAARVIFGCGVPVVQLPCAGVVDRFATTRYELEHWLSGKSALCDYLVENTIQEAEDYAAGKPWSRVIWDVTAVAWLVDKRFVMTRVLPVRLPGYDHRYEQTEQEHLMAYVYNIDRNRLMKDLVEKLIK